jgi:hypothetical protein
MLYGGSRSQRKVPGENIRVERSSHIAVDGAVFAEFVSSVHLFYFLYFFGIVYPTQVVVYLDLLVMPVITWQ